MQLTVLQILNATESMVKINSAELPIGLALKISKNKTQLDEVRAEFEIRRNAIFKEYGEENEGRITIPKENLEVVNAKINEFTDEEVDLDLIQINVADLGDDIKISANDIVNLEWLLITKDEAIAS